MTDIHGLQVFNDQGLLILDTDEAPSRFIYSHRVNHVNPNLSIDIRPYLPEENVDLTAVMLVEFARAEGNSADLKDLNIPYQVYIEGTRLRIVWPASSASAMRLRGYAMVLAV